VGPGTGMDPRTPQNFIRIMFSLILKMAMMFISRIPLKVNE